MYNINESLIAIESTIRNVGSTRSDHSKARREIRSSLQQLTELKPDSSLSLAQTISSIENLSNIPQNWYIGVALIRLLSDTTVFPESSRSQGRIAIVRLIEAACPNLFKVVIQNEKLQTHEQLQSLSQIHPRACQQLQGLKKTFNSLPELNGRRQVLLRELNRGPFKPYLNTFDFKAIRSTVASLMQMTADVVDAQGRTLHLSLQRLNETLIDELEHYESIPSFLVQDYLLPFLVNLQNVSLNLQDAMAQEFQCHIIISENPYEIEKKYPLHIPDSTITISLPLHNTGPGIAQNVRVICIAENCDVIAEDTILGDIEPGEFIFQPILRVIESTKCLNLEIEVQWSIVGDPTKRTEEFSVFAQCQRDDIDWDSLYLKTPYSLEVALHDDFFGRKDGLNRILKRLSPSSMQSSFITGQKRVGKSSLARAVETNLCSDFHGPAYHVLYVECGEIRHASAQETLSALGTTLEDFILPLLPPHVQWKSRNYSTSLAPLNQLLNLLKKTASQTRIVFVLDEFDEINEDLYRRGELAETFFLNLRTISSKSNIAFLLVGAERMPYVITSQGDKLNKFDRESLDSFGADEWSDYCDMIEIPVSDSIKYYPSALRKLFEITAGNPYFTKLLCARIVESAVNAKDAEVSYDDVEKISSDIVATLDTNAFAHYWQDGIRGDADDIEIVSLKRRRVLVAWARTARTGSLTNSAEIRKNVYSANFDSTELQPLINDFCRRDIFVEKEGSYQPRVSLFGTWLKEGGFTSLISDRLGDELSDAKQKQEDAAYVHSKQIVQLATSWPLFQGRQISEDKIRAWIDQAESNVHRRILFSLLTHVRFISETEVRQGFARAHLRIHSLLPIPIIRARTQRRSDIFVSYVDGPAKSGAHFAQLYAAANSITSKNVIERARFDMLPSQSFGDKAIGLVIVDDMIGTGNSLIRNLSSLPSSFLDWLRSSEYPFSIIVFCSTMQGEDEVRKYLGEQIPTAALEICEVLDDAHYAFPNSGGVWASTAERDEAKAIVSEFGSQVQKRNPLGYGKQGLLITFERNCPNNSLPILHGTGKGKSEWMPLFPRLKL